MGPPRARRVLHATVPKVPTLQKSMIIYNLHIMQKVKWNDLTPLRQDNLDYEPEMDEIIEYAQFIGLILPQDNKYLHLALEGLKAPLPPFWQACEDAQGELFFRNRKTRVITLENPLDEIYIQKVRQIRLAEGNHSIFPIVEESALNQSSGLAKSRPQPSAQTHANRILQRHITEESVYSEPSAEKGSPGKPDLQEEPQWKIQQRMQIAQLRAKIQRFVPQRKQLITQVTQIQAKGLQNIMNLENVANLTDLRAQVEAERVKLQQRKRLRKELHATLDQVRSQTKHY